MRQLGRERRGRTSDRKELNVGSSSVCLDWSFSGSEIENCNPVEGGEAGFGSTFMGLLVDRRGEAGVLSGQAGLEGIFNVGEIGDKKVTTELVEGGGGGPNQKAWEVENLLLGRKGLKDNRHKEERLSVMRFKKRIRTNLNRGN